MAQTTLKSQQAFGGDGWNSAGETWTYASASTFTIAGTDVTTKYTKGTRLKFTQTTVKYAVVVSSSFSTDTTVTIAVNTDYTIANAAISANYYSYQANPQGYPGWFNYTTTTAVTGGGAFTPNFRVQKFRVIGNECHVYWEANNGTVTGTATYIDFSLPINDAFETTAGFELGLAGYAQGSNTYMRITSNDGTKVAIKHPTGNWTATTGYYFGFHYIYQI